MATITINEVSRNYNYSTSNMTFCSVAMPMTASWGPAFEDPATLGVTLEEELEACAFTHFPSTHEGLEAFIATYRGPAANYRASKDFSYHIALTLLTAGYDVDICRVSCGVHASERLNATIDDGTTTSTGFVSFTAKYPGSFGNNLIVSIRKVINRTYWNMIVYVADANGSRTAVENMTFVFDLDNSSDSIPHISEIRSSFVDIVVDNIQTDVGVTFAFEAIQLTNGSDRAPDTTAAAMMNDAIALANARFALVPATNATDYDAALSAVAASNPSISKAATVKYMEWNYNAAYYVLELLTDKLAYNSKRLIMPGWDDQNFWALSGETVPRMSSLSPLHVRMMEVAAQSRCLAALLDIPKSLQRAGVWIDSPSPSLEGYAQKISNYTPDLSISSDGLFSTHSALFAPWCQYRYAGTSRNNIAPPAFIALMMQIAMMKNQSIQYEWAQPQTRKHNLVIGSPDYKVPKKLLDNWQSIEGISLNVICQIPDLGLTLWGNSTCFNVPPATYQALQNLSTRYLMDAIEDVVYRVGVGITFQYNNQEAYSQFYAGCTPILDTMKSVGAITAYEITMSKDINGFDSVNLNSVIGQIIIYVEGVINNITVDLIALPAGTEEVS